MRNGETIYHCRRISCKTDDVKRYAPPKTYILRFGFLTVQPASGFSSIVLYGTRISETWIAIADYNAFRGVFSPGDLLYIDGKYPLEGEENGSTANAVVDAVSYQNRVIRIVLKSTEENDGDYV